MEYKFASDYAREVSEKIQGDIDRILAQRREASNAAKEEARYQEQREKMDDQLYGYTKTSMEVAPSGLEGHYVDGVQYALDEMQKASTQHKLNPTEGNRLKMNQARQQYENIKNIATAKSAQNFQTMTSIRNGSIKNLASRDGLSGVDYAEKQYSEYSQAPSWQLSEDGKLMIMQEGGGLVDWNTTRYADLNDVFVPQIKAEEGAFMSGNMAESLFKNRFQSHEVDYTVKESEYGLPIGELDSEKYYADIAAAIRQEGISNPQMWTAASLEQSKRDNPGRGDMTPKDQTDALTIYNTDFQQMYLHLEDDKKVGVTEGSFNSSGEWVFAVDDSVIDSSNRLEEEKNDMKSWRKAYKNYAESVARGVEGLMKLPDATAQIMNMKDRDERQASAAAINAKKAQIAAQADIQAELDDTHGVRQGEVNGQTMYFVDMPSLDLKITVPKTDTGGKAYSYEDNTIEDDGIAGKTNVAVSEIQYYYNNGEPYPVQIKINATAKASGSGLAGRRGGSSTASDYVISVNDDAFEAVWQSIMNKQKAYNALSPVPLKIYALENDIIDETEFSSTGFDYDKAIEASDMMQKTSLLPPYMR